MYYSNDVISYLQSNKILALKLDHAVSSVKDQVIKQVENIGAGATRALYYTSCLTEEYQDVCQQQKSEDIRFFNGLIYLLQHGGVVCDILKIYFEEILKYKTSAQLEHIKKLLMEINIHIAASSITKTGFSLAVATAVAVGMNLSLEMSAQAGRGARRAMGFIGIYGVVQKAASSAHRLQISYPSYYAALYENELEMMYFLTEPIFERAEAAKAQWGTEEDIANIIARMIR